MLDKTAAQNFDVDLSAVRSLASVVPGPLPTALNGAETPYSLNVDRARQQVWVTGTASDSLMRLDIASGQWRTFPMPRKVTFTRDIEIAADGSVFTSNGAFPSWQIEDGQPTLIQLTPGD